MPSLPVPWQQLQMWSNNLLVCSERPHWFQWLDQKLPLVSNNKEAKHGHKAATASNCVIRMRAFTGCHGNSTVTMQPRSMTSVLFQDLTTVTPRTESFTAAAWAWQLTGASAWTGTLHSSAMKAETLFKTTPALTESGRTITAGQRATCAKSSCVCRCRNCDFCSVCWMQSAARTKSNQTCTEPCCTFKSNLVVGAVLSDCVGKVLAQAMFFLPYLVKMFGLYILQISLMFFLQ